MLMQRSYAVGGSGWLYGAGDPVFLLLAAIPFAVAIGLWVLLARSAFIQGDDVERPNRVAQLYGYAVCLIAIVVFIASMTSLVENAFTLANPLQSRESDFGMEPSVTSFESYRSTYDRERQMREPLTAAAVRDTVPEQVLRQRYEALRADRVARTRFQAQRSLTTSALSLLIAVGLFGVHWRWLRSRDNEVPAVAVRG